MHVYTCIIRFMHDTAKRSAIQGLSQKRSVRAVVFDYGNVLCLEQTLEDMKGMALVCGIPHERFSELYWKLRPPYDRGDIDGPAYWTAVVGQQELGLSRDQIATLIKLDSESITRPNQGAVQCPLVLQTIAEFTKKYKETVTERDAERSEERKELSHREWVYQLTRVKTHPLRGDEAVVKLIDIGFKSTGEIQPATYVTQVIANAQATYEAARETPLPTGLAARL